MKFLLYFKLSLSRLFISMAQYHDSNLNRKLRLLDPKAYDDRRSKLGRILEEKDLVQPYM